MMDEDPARTLALLVGGTPQTREITLPDGATAYEHTFTPPGVADLPVLDWRPFQYAMVNVGDMLADLAPKLADLLHGIAPMVHDVQRIRLRAAKTRAHLSTQIPRHRTRRPQTPRESATGA